LADWLIEERALPSGLIFVHQKSVHQFNQWSNPSALFSARFAALRFDETTKIYSSLVS
jgi:hypothetical protein